MTPDPDLTTLSRSLVALPGFAWRAGMLSACGWRVLMTLGPIIDASAGCSGEVARFRGDDVIRNALDVEAPSTWSPDLTDDATGGCLMALLGPTWSARRVLVDLWHVTDGTRTFYAGKTLAEAAARALVAIGRVP